jgi:hypothetical protein
MAAPATEDNPHFYQHWRQMSRRERHPVGLPIAPPMPQALYNADGPVAQGPLRPDSMQNAAAAGDPRAARLNSFGGPEPQRSPTVVDRIRGLAGSASSAISTLDAAARQGIAAAVPLETRLDLRRQQEQKNAARDRAAEAAAFDSGAAGNQLQQSTFSMGLPSEQSLEGETSAVVGRQESNLRDMDATKSAQEKVQKYRDAVAEFRARREDMLSRGMQFDMSDPANRPPMMPSLSAAERNMLDISYPEEVSGAAWDRYGTSAVDLFIQNQGLTKTVIGEDGNETLVPLTREDVTGNQELLDRYETWASDNFGNYDDEDYVSPERARENINQDVEYQPFTSPPAPNRDPRMRYDPRQTGDPRYVERDGTVNIDTAQGRGARVPVYGVGERGGSGMGRRTAGGESLSPEYLDQVFEDDEDQKALYYAESAGYDLSDENMSEAERIGKARKIYADHKARFRSNDVTFDDAAGTDGEWRYTENQASKDRKFQRQAYGRFYRAVLDDPRAYPEFIGSDGEPDRDKIEAYLTEHNLVPTPIDSTRDDGVAHSADKDRVERQQLRRVESAVGRGEAYRQQQEMMGAEQNMRNPAINRQMLMESIREAEQRGASQQEIARIYEFYGVGGAAAAERALGARQMEADAMVDAAEAANQPAEEEDLPVERSRANYQAASDVYSEDPASPANYGEALRYTTNLVAAERAETGQSALEGEELEVEAAAALAHSWLTSPKGNAQMMAAVNQTDPAKRQQEMANFIRLPAISSFLEVTANSQEDTRSGLFWWRDDKYQHMKPQFIADIMGQLGLNGAYAELVADWFDDYAARVSGGG